MKRELESENFMDWMFNKEEKIEEFNKIIEHMKMVYLSETKDWILGMSFGKDSSLLLYLVWKMLERLQPNERHKNVYVISADTKVETPLMKNYVEKNLIGVNKYGAHLGIKTVYVTPEIKHSFFYNVIGKGLGAPQGNSRFTWCSSKMKIAPMNTALTKILSMQSISFSQDSYDATLLLGTRLDESEKRARKIRKYEVDDYFGRHTTFNNIRVYNPIKLVNTSDLWNYMDLEVKVFPWGISYLELRSMYEDGKECPIIRSAQDKACGGSSRNGCFTCLMTGRKDPMLDNLIERGYTDAIYLAEWKAYLYDISNDIRHREPLRRREYETFLRADELQFHSIFPDENSQLQYEESFNNFKRTFKGNENGEYRPGGFAFPVRKKLLEKLLYCENRIQKSLIEEDELRAILNAWEEDGYSVKRDEIQPVNHQIESTLVFKPDWSINYEASTLISPVFFVEQYFRLEANELLAYYKERQQYTGKHLFCYFDHDEEPKRKQVWNKAVFIINETDIWTQEEANRFVVNWLYLEYGDSKGISGKQYTKMTDASYHALMKHLLILNIKDANIINHIVKTI